MRNNLINYFLWQTTFKCNFLVRSDPSTIFRHWLDFSDEDLIFQRRLLFYPIPSLFSLQFLISNHSLSSLSLPSLTPYSLAHHLYLAFSFSSTLAKRCHWTQPLLLILFPSLPKLLPLFSVSTLTINGNKLGGRGSFLRLTTLEGHGFLRVNINKLILLCNHGEMREQRWNDKFIGDSNRGCHLKERREREWFL